MGVIEGIIGVLTISGSVFAAANYVGGRLFKFALKQDEAADLIRDATVKIEAIRFNTNRLTERVRDLENYLEKTSDFRRRDYGPPG